MAGNRAVTAITASPPIDAATRRLSYCVLVSLFLHLGLSSLKPGSGFGLETPAADVSRAPAALEIRLSGRTQAVAGNTQETSPSPAAAGASSIGKAADDRNAVRSPLPAFEPPQKQALPPVVNGMFVGPWYFSAQYLHRRPSPLRPIRPDYPAVTDNEVHTVRLLMLIGATGVVDSYRMSGEKDTAFAKAVIDAFTTVDYAPGLISNIPVKSQLLVEVTFHPGDGSFHTNMVVPDGAKLQLPVADRPGL